MSQLTRQEDFLKDFELTPISFGHVGHVAILLKIDVQRSGDTRHHKEEEPERETQVLHPRSSSVLPAMALALLALFPVVTTRFFGDAFGVAAADDDADEVLAADVCVFVGRCRR